MSVSKKLFILIKKLDASEKKHFRDLSKRFKEQTLYLKLFNLIDKSEDYNEEKIKKTLKIKDNFHTYKNHLYHLILKSQRLILFDKKGIPNYTDIQLMGLMMDVQILEQKGLSKDARELLKLARKKAEKEDKNQLLLTLLKKELDFINRKDTQKMQEQATFIFAKIQNCLKTLEVENHYWKYYYEIAVFIRKRGGVTPEQKNDLVTRIKTDDLLKEEQEIASFTAKYLFYYIKAYQYYFIGEYQLYHDFLGKTIQVWEDNKSKKKEEPRNYKVFLANYANSCSLVKSFDKIPPLLKKLEEIETTSFSEEAETFISIAFLRLFYYLNTTDFNQSVIDLTDINKTIDGIKKGLEKYQNSLPKSRELAFYYNVSILFSLIRDFYRASDWLDKILNEPKNEHRKDLVRVAHVLQLIYQLELGHTETAASLCQSVTRKFNRWGGIQQHEQIIISYIKQIIYALDADKKMLYKDFYKALSDFQKENAKIITIGLEEILLWLEYKVNNFK